LIGLRCFVRKIKCRSKSSIYGTVWGAKKIHALWHLLKGFFYFINIFIEKEGFLKYM